MLSAACFGLILAMLVGGQSSPARKAARSVREGNFLVTALRVWVPVASSNPSSRYHSVVVEVTIKNVSQRVTDTGLVLPWLKVRPEPTALLRIECPAPITRDQRPREESAARKA
jgi:hypothetical protein